MLCRQRFMLCTFSLSEVASFNNSLSIIATWLFSLLLSKVSFTINVTFFLTIVPNFHFSLTDIIAHLLIMNIIIFTGMPLLVFLIYNNLYRAEAGGTGIYYITSGRASGSIGFIRTAREKRYG